ncbi:MAG: hypothetical protein LBK64_02655, partial [Spirochaetaceae bacterium]|nr:hypothetical protein [Spirochaetaceae bacterium]
MMKNAALYLLVFSGCLAGCTGGGQRADEAKTLAVFPSDMAASSGQRGAAFDGPFDLPPGNALVLVR